MTLIVAHKTDHDVFMVGDSRLTDEQEEFHPLKGTLKIQILSDNICVGFAGDIPCDCFKQLKLIFSADKSYDELVQNLLMLHKEHNGKIDFLISQSLPAPSLIKISNAAIIPNLITAWIGEESAFREYQKYFLDKTPPLLPSAPERPQLWILKLPDHKHSEQSRFAKMCSAIQSVMANTTIKTVGDYLIPVASSAEGFHYQPYCYVDAPEQEPGIGWTTVEMGSNIEGGYAISALTPKEGGVPLFAIHFLQGGFFILFHYSKSYIPIIYKGFSHESFIEKIYEEYEILLEGPKFT